MSVRRVTIETDGLTVTRLAWDVYRSTAEGLVETIYELNPGIGKLGITLPIGLAISLPLAAPATQTERAVIKLWD